jgi:tyrosyl-tRNA synthetase
MKEISALSAPEGEEINQAKEVLAFEVTKLVPGEAAAGKAREAATALFAGDGWLYDAPATFADRSRFEGDGTGVADLIREIGLTASNGEAFRLIEQGGLSINGAVITDKKYRVTTEIFSDNSILIKKGKKTFHRIRIR